MLVIGLTGGIGSGKSTVADYFKSLGVVVIDADDITRELAEPGQEAYREIAEHFGNEIIQPGGKLDRSRLRKVVFENPDQRRVLEKILHPRARKIAQARIAELNTPYCILSVPLLFESDWTDLVQRILVVDIPEELQIERTSRRDGITREQVRTIIDSQASRKTRLDRADDILENTGDLATLQEKIHALHRNYLQLAKSAAKS